MLVLSTRKGYIHNLKTAGTAVIDLVRRNFKDQVEFYVNHNPLSHVPCQWQNYTWYSTVRNPITWYSSMYSFFIEKMKECQCIPSFNATYFLIKPENEPFLKPVYVSFDEFLDRALNFSDYWNLHPEFNDYIYNNNLIAFRTIRQLLGPLNNIQVYEKTLYEFKYNRFGLNKTINFRMEDQFKDILFALTDDIKFAEYFKNTKIKITNSKVRVSKKQQKRIFKKDKYFFKKYGYKKVKEWYRPY